VAIPTSTTLPRYAATDQGLEREHELLKYIDRTELENGTSEYEGSFRKPDLPNPWCIGTRRKVNQQEV
jgi:hypothetical protein